MKKTIILIALIFVSIATMSQTKFGVRAGMTVSTYYSAQDIYQFKPGIHIGGVADIPIASSRFSFVTGMYFADKGTKTEGYFPPDNVYFASQVDQYFFKGTHYNYQLEIPLLFTYKILINDKLTLNPQIGAFVSYTIFGRINEKRDYQSTILFEIPPKYPIDYYFYNDTYLGFGGNVGVAAFYKKYSFTFSCDIGYNNHPNSTTEFFYSNNNYPDICMFFSLGYNF